MEINEQICVAFVREGASTRARATAMLGGYTFSAGGTTVRRPGDPDNPHVGYLLAASRALSELKQMMEGRAEQMMPPAGWQAGHAYRNDIGGKVHVLHVLPNGDAIVADAREPLVIPGKFVLLTAGEAAHHQEV